MSHLPRLALGTVDPGPEGPYVVWGLLRLLQAQGLQIQHFHSQASFSPVEGARVATGLRSRHLDSWLMSPEVCRFLLRRCVGTCDLAVVDGHFSGPAGPWASASSLQDLSAWLGLPRVAVIDVRRLDRCRVPAPVEVDAIFLHGLRSSAELAYWQTVLEGLWGVPVVGGMQAVEGLYRELQALAPGRKPDRSQCDTLAQAVARFTPVERVLRLAQQAPELPHSPIHWPDSLPARPIRIALAYDKAFDCYFPDTLDALESLGAELLTFSPLRDESLPSGVDVVYLGCGHPERWASRLAANCCMIAALRKFADAGGRIYAEGGGLAYLCQALEDWRGRRWTMVGALPLLARPRKQLLPPLPAQIVLKHDTWLAPSGTVLRGYQNPLWELLLLQPDGNLQPRKIPDASLLCSAGVLGSTLHLNFVAQEQLLTGFLSPQVC